MAKADLKRHWKPTEAAFQRLLAWLDQGSDSQGQRYLDVRDRLVSYFARRNCLMSEDLADETLNRVARRLEETGSIDDVTPPRYCYIVAKFVWLECLRQLARQSDTSLSEELLHGAAPADAGDEPDRTMACLERCLDERTPSERGLILDYYGTESGRSSVRRKQLAEQLGLTANSLAIRACRIRSRLEVCVRTCLER